MLALLVCLNEQAVKEINQTEDGHDLEIGQQRLLKAYRMVNEAKGKFDATHRAIINYNLACSYQIQGDLPNCSKFLLASITFLEEKLEIVKKHSTTIATISD